MKEKNNVLISGVSGFLGVNLQNYLRPLFKVIPLSIRYKPNQQLELKANAVIHLAGKAHDLNKMSKATNYYKANFELTKQLYDSFLKSNASIFIYMSTVKAVADRVNGILTEDENPNPKTHYGISKYKAESYILSQELPIDKRVYILRPCMIHGPENKGNLNLLFRVVRKGFPWPLGAFKNQRSFLSIENFCFIIKELLENIEIPSGIYNLADDEPLSTNELIELIAISQNKRTTIINISKGFIYCLAKLGDYLHLPLNSERLQKLTENYVVSNKKIVMAIGKHLPIESKKGLLNTFKSLKNINT